MRSRHTLLSAGCIAIGAFLPSVGHSAQAGLVALVDAVKTPAKFTGQKACWVGAQMAYSISTDPQGRQETSTTWMALDANGKVVPDQVFVANEAQVKRTDAADKLDHTSGDPNERLVCGTIMGSKEVAVRVGGEVRKPLVPVLGAVTLDAPAKK